MSNRKRTETVRGYRVEFEWDEWSFSKPKGKWVVWAKCPYPDCGRRMDEIGATVDKTINSLKKRMAKHHRDDQWKNSQN